MAIRILIEGRVQGVGYRAWVEHQAGVLRVRGWVRNLDDGRVEAWLEGAPEAVEALIERAHRGPPLARVGRVVRYVEPDQDPPTFVRRPTASVGSARE